MLQVNVLYNQPLLAESDPDWASEAGVLEAVEAIAAALESRGHGVRRVAVRSSAAEVVEALANGPAADVVVNLCEGLGGTGAGEANVAGLVELCGLPLTGSPPECLALVRDKARTKWLLQGAGLPTAPFFHIAEGDRLPREPLRLALAEGPWLVKPAKEDASLGISQESVVSDLAALERQVELVHGRYGDVLIERYIAGREFNAGIVALDEAMALPIAEIQFGEHSQQSWRLVTYDAKWTPGSDDYASTPVACPAPIDAQLAARIEQAALAAFRLTGCRDYGRVDFRVDDVGEVYILEVNANPDLSPSAGFARGLAVAGIGYDDFVERLAQSAAARHLRRNTCSSDSLTGVERGSRRCAVSRFPI
jgi:D-alanine-D-alanine ligase